jgi:ribulose kinase
MRAAIGLDIGTTAVKALAVDVSGAVLARAERSTRCPRHSRAGPSRIRPTGGARRSRRWIALGVDEPAGIG